MTRPTLSTRQASRKTADAADQLLDWLRQQNGLPDGNGKGHADRGHTAGGGAEVPNPDPPMLPPREDAALWFNKAPGREHGVDRSPTRRDEGTPRKPAQSFAFAEPRDFAEEAAQAVAPLRPRHTDWLHHRLLVAGPAGVLADFQAAAGGAGTVPWRLDLDRMEEDLFLMLAAPPPPQRRRLSLAGARTLAGQLRDAAERRHGAAMARVGQSRACAFDLHALVPVPSAVLQLGSDHPEALA